MITVKQMQKLDRLAHKQGVFTADLMENAGREVFKAVKEKYDLVGRDVIIFAGTGNNAGDGFVAARYFSQEVPVVVLFFGDKEKLSEEAKDNYDQINDSITIVKITSKEDLENFHFQPNHELILIDALLGTGIEGRVREPVALGIDYFNSLNGEKIAVDVPSGVNPDTGEEADKVCRVNLIITLHDIKVGLVKFKDKTVIVDIGIPIQLLPSSAS